MPPDCGDRPPDQPLFRPLPRSTFGSRPNIGPLLRRHAAVGSEGRSDGGSIKKVPQT